MNNSDTFVFIGPTISPEEASQWLNATYLPPVSQGDIASLLEQEPHTIGIIDGYFERVPAVWHKEILLALSRGVYVIGGASMGALRAAELHPFGMVGVGKIFRWYRDGKIEADDEVAVRHGPAEFDYLVMSEALVNIRATLAAAHSDEVITKKTKHDLLNTAKSIQYPERSYEKLLQQGAAQEVSETELAALRTFLAEGKIDQKKRDAVSLLQYIARHKTQQQQSFSIDFELQQTDKLKALLDKDICLNSLQDDVRLTADTLVNQARLEIDDFAGFRRRANENEQWLAQAQQQNVVLNASEFEEMRQYARQHFELENDSEYLQWREQNHLAASQFSTFIREWGLIRKTKAGGNQADRNHTNKKDEHSTQTRATNRALIRQMRIEGLYPKIAQTTMEKVEMPPPEQPLSTARLHQYYCKRKQINPVPDIGTHAKQLDFTNVDVFRESLLKYYQYYRKREAKVLQWLTSIPDASSSSQA